MPWSAQGFWTPEEDDVGTQVAKVVNAGGPLMKAAKGLGIATANRRGLANSSIAAGASQAEVLKAAVPIAGQSAAQIAQKNLAALEANNQMKYGTTLQQMQDEAAKERLGLQIGSTERISGNEITARSGDIDRQLGSQERMHGLGIASDERMQGNQIASTERLTAQEIAARMSELTTRIDADRVLAAQGDEAAMARLQADLGSRAQLAALDASTQTNIASMREAGETSRLTASLASSERLSAAEIAARSNELSQRIEADLALAERGDAAAMDRLSAQLGSNERLSANEIAARASELTTRIEADRELAAQGDTAAMDRLSAQLGSTERLSAAELEARRTELDTRIAADRELAAQGDEAAMARLEADLASRAQLQTQGDEAAAERQRMADLGALERQREELANRTDLSAADREARLTEIDRQIAGNRELAQINSAADLERQRLANEGGLEQQRLQSTTSLNIADMEAAQSGRNTAVNASVNLNAAYMDAMGNSMANADIPANVRTTYQQSIQAATEASLNVIEQITGTNLSWTTTGGSSEIPAGMRPVMTQGASPDAPGVDWRQLPSGEWYLPSNGYVPA